MTISQDPSGATSLSHIVVRPADADDYDSSVRCPDCGLDIDEQEGIHHIPSDVVDGIAIGQEIPVFGYRCDRHRQPHVLPAPVALAPNSFETVRLEIGGGLEAGCPTSAADGGESDEQ